ncbi:MAG: hypothetical protein AAFS10_09840 [Myxococcota bacterium]
MNPTTKHNPPPTTALNLLKGAWRLALGALFPPRCLGCDGFIPWPQAHQAPDTSGPERWFCPSCLPGLTPLAKACPQCAFPLHRALDWAPLEHCPRCATDPPPWERTLAVYNHLGPAREALHRLKFGRQRQVAVGLAHLMAPLLASALDNGGADARPDLIVPIPLGPARLKARGFNQARLLAEGLGARLDLTWAQEGILTRPIQSQSQHRLGRQERLSQEKGGDLAFVAQRKGLEGRTVALVDDVMTTGATARAATQAVEAVGGKVIWVWVWSRA